MFKLAEVFSTIFFIGNSKFMPGTIGTLISIILIFFLNKIVSNFIFISIFLIIFFLSLIFIEIYSRTINKYDSKEIIIDEFLGIYFIIIFFKYFNYFVFINFITFCKKLIYNFNTYYFNIKVIKIKRI